MIEEGLTTLIASTSAVTAICGNRISPVVLKTTDALPAITYHDVSGSMTPALNNAAISYRRIQFDCWANTYSEAKHLQAALISLLAGYSGNLSDGTLVQNTTLATAIDLFESDALTYRSVADFVFTFVPAN